jgi:hypothetical protein
MRKARGEELLLGIRGWKIQSQVVERSLRQSCPIESRFAVASLERAGRDQAGSEWSVCGEDWERVN